MPGLIRVDAAAARVTARVPYLCYARKDRKTKARAPVTTRYVACLFEAWGAIATSMPPLAPCKPSPKP
ncbi:ribose-phosphate pyrophosphokinase-like domain-containing protein [Nodosilinea sp. LEGE 07088]|uniref:ribose-phosphate pyrophosphokinase-like domain-containing protein n=1 Tax=Nodosilinea sp. LEGE 07088 TaxID=2777968 RepID=UPI0034D97895